MNAGTLNTGKTETLKKRAERLKQDLDLLQQIRTNMKLIGSLKTRRDQLAGDPAKNPGPQKDILPRLRRLKQSHDALIAEGVSVSYRENFPDFAYAQARGYSELAASFRANPLSLIEGEELSKIRTQIERSDDLHTMLKQILSEAWRSHVRSRQFQVDEQILRVLQRVPTYLEKIEAVRGAAQQVAAFCNRLPIRRDEIQALDVAAAALRRAWNELEQSGLSPEVYRFLTALGTGDAPLALLTDSVRDWMRDQNVETLFCVRIAGVAPASPVSAVMQTATPAYRRGI